MQEAGVSGRDLNPAEEAFVEFLAQEDAPHAVGFETFVRDRAPLESQLRRMYEEWVSIARVLGRTRESDPTPPKAEEDDTIFDYEDLGLKLEATGELLRRLAANRTPPGRYELGGEVARGGMGLILRTWDPHLRRNLAMKVILARGDITNPQERRLAMRRALVRFLEEAQITSQLDHPGVVPVHDLGIDARGRLYFTMRLVRGRDFEQVLHLARTGREGWTLARALGVLLKVCEALAYAHSKGVIHRDLKPANVMVGQFGEVYVMDWGLARVLGQPDHRDLRVRPPVDGLAVQTTVRKDLAQSKDSPLLTMDGHVIGTPSYMSPEQAGGAIERMGPQSDVYSVGTLLYQLLTGRTPYVAPGTTPPPAAVLSMLLDGPPPPVLGLAPDAPDGLVEICEKAMARDPRQRYAGTLEIAQDIEAWLSKKPVSAHDATAGYLLRLFFARNRTMSVTVTAALLLLAIVVSVAWRNNQQAFQRKEAALEQTQRLLDLRTVQTLAANVDDLFPPAPENVPRFERWLAEARALLAQRVQLQRELAATPPPVDEERRLLAATLAHMGPLEQLVPAVERWYLAARSIDQISLIDAKDAWSATCAAVAASPRYDGMQLEPKRGLVPLRENRETGLWEFWAVLTGTRPEIADDLPTGYEMTDAMGMVFVLLPGSRARIGESGDGANPNEWPREVELQPTFLSKFEVTQAQWKLVMGNEPWTYGPGIELDYAGHGVASVPDGRKSNWLHPVESVNWFECSRFVRRIGMELPSEDLWEYGARAGTTTRFWWGDDLLGADGMSGADSIVGKENIYDNFGGYLGQTEPPFKLNDGYPFHAPVGSFEPNAFGLYDVLGNVCEWCADREPTPRVTKVRRALRGGFFFAVKETVYRCSFRMYDNPDVEQCTWGFRPSIPVEP